MRLAAIQNKSNTEFLNGLKFSINVRYTYFSISKSLPTKISNILTWIKDPILVFMMLSSAYHSLIR